MIAVTGATGFLGHSLVPLLIERGHQVRCLVRPTSDAQFLIERGVELVCGDTREPAAALKLVDGCEAVIHAAGHFRFWGKYEDFFNTNVRGTHHVAEAARRVGVRRFIHLSTVAVVGVPKPGTFIDELYPCAPRDAYQQSKLDGEGVILHQTRDCGLPAIILRPGAFYGPYGHYAWNRIFFEDPHIRRLPLQIHRGQHLTFPIFTPDLAHVIEAALTRGTPGEVYNVCGPSLTHHAANEVIARLLGRDTHFINAPQWGMLWLARLMTLFGNLVRHEPFYPINLATYVFYDWIVNSDKARRELGFEPTPFEDGARITIEWYRKMGYFRNSSTPGQR